MSQTIYAIIALMLLSLFVFQQRRSTIRMQQTMVHNAVAVVAHGVAVERLSKIRSMSYDQATANDTFINSASELTPVQEFGPSQDVENDDVDDFHGASVNVERAVGEGTLTFRVETTVHYADEDDPAQARTDDTRTRYKKVAVRVYNLDVAGTDTIAIAQTVSCKNACNWGS